MDPTQFHQFMDAFANTMADVVKEIKKEKGKGVASGSGSSSSTDVVPKISLRVPIFKEEPGENIEVWLRQTKNIIRAQNIKDKGQMIHYAATGFENAALH